MKSYFLCYFSFLVFTSALPQRASCASVQLTVHSSETAGKIRPLHSSNGGPIAAGGMVDTTEWHRQAGFPLMRLHDCQWPEPAVVDLHTIFRDFRNDPLDAASYYFLRTDDYLAAITNTGSGVFFRLGESIEHSRRKYDVHPPKDYEKWAQICLGIIRHYNEGWADGFHHNIRYWEIWNEPEVRPQMWSGSDEDYYRLYAVTAKAIKGAFPKLKVGGPAAANAGTFKAGELEPTPFLAGFFKQCRDQSLPLDFFSWHVYADNPQVIILLAAGVRRMLDRFGFHDTESHLDEWNYLPRNDWNTFARGTPEQREQWYGEMTGPAGAAFTACTLSGLQDTPLDMAYYYSAETQGFGLFSQYGEPRKAFYAIKAFRQMLDTPTRLNCSQPPDGFTILAGLNDDRSRLNILLSNFKAPIDSVELKIASLPWPGKTHCDQIETSPSATWKTSESEEFSTRDAKLSLHVPAGTIILLQLKSTGTQSPLQILR